MKKILSLSLLTCLTLAAQAEDFVVSSPDGRLAVEVQLSDGRLSYSAKYDGAQMLTSSRLGVVADLDDFSEKLAFVKKEEGKVERSYDMTRTKMAHHDYKANQLNLTVKTPKDYEMTLTLEVSDNDVAYRYSFPKYEKAAHRVLKVYKEVSGFNFPTQTTTFLSPQIQPMTGWEHTKPSYEEEYQPDAALTAPSQYGVGYTFPCLFKVGTDGWVMVNETGVTGRYCGSRLSEYDPQTGFTIAFPQEGENNGFGSAYAAFGLPGSTPWRTITMGKTLAPVIETMVQYDVVEPLYQASKDYQPGRYTWSWLIWQDNSITKEDQTQFIDLAAKFGYEYVLVDNWWDTKIGREEMARLSAYAQSKGVRLMLWYNSNGLQNDAPQGPRNIMNNPIARKQEMAWMKSIGIAGIKVDFFGGDKQETMALYESILSDANDYGLAVIFHGCTVARGWERMYPNYIASEAALASENVFFTDYHAKKEGFELTMYPYTRNAASSFDWGGVIMNKYLSKDNKSRHQRYTTDVFELATAITNQCSVNCVEVTPNGIDQLTADEIEWLKQMPTAWSDTKFIDGYPGQSAFIARQSSTDGRWFMGGLNGTDEKLTKTLSLPMMAGQTVKIFQDNAKREPVLKTAKVGKDGTIKVTLQPLGGVVIYQ